MLLDTVRTTSCRKRLTRPVRSRAASHGMQARSLARWYSKNAPNPAGWDMGAKSTSGKPWTRAATTVGDPFDRRRPRLLRDVDDEGPRDGRSRNIRVRSRFREVGARNGDFTLPTVLILRPSRDEEAAVHISKRIRDADDDVAAGLQHPAGSDRTLACRGGRNP